MSDQVQQLRSGNKRVLARVITQIENEQDGYERLLEALRPDNNVPVVGITGPPGAGKSTLIAALTKHLTASGKKVAILAIDPSSPFNHGAIMGDRIRMSDHFLHPHVFIRSMASRGSLGGLAPKTVEVTDVIRSAGYDIIFIETVGVGQSEVEIAGLAGTTILTLVPEAGDEIQTIKSGIMEIADVFVLNKSDREGASVFLKNLKLLAHEHIRDGWESPVVATIASRQEGIAELVQAIEDHQHKGLNKERKYYLLAEKAMMLIKERRTRDISFGTIYQQICAQAEDKNFNLYRYVNSFSKA